MRRLLLLIALLIPALPLRADSVLVFPFSSAPGADSRLDWIGVSLSQTVREVLATQGLLVLDREDREEVYRRLSIRPFARLTRASMIKVAEALDATQVVYGDFAFTPAPASASPGGSRGTLRLNAYVIDMKRMRKGPQFTETGPLEDLARLQMHLSWQTLRYLSPGTAPSEGEFTKQQTPVRVDAMENYIRGLLATTPEQKHRFFTQAVRIDDGFSQPCFELGRMYWGRKEYRLAADWLARVKPADPHFLEANFLLGVCRYYIAEYQRAEEAFKLVGESVPLNEVFNNLGAAESRLGKTGALANFEKALEGDEADPDYHFNVGYALWKEGRFAAAADRFRAVLERNPDDKQATLMLGRCLSKTGPRPGTAVEALERIKLNYEERAYRELKAALEVKKK